MTEPVRDLLTGVLRSLNGRKNASNASLIALEFGSGGSTAFFAQYSKMYYAIESSPKFFHDVNATVNSIPNVQLVLREANVEHVSGDHTLLQSHKMYQVMKNVRHSSETMESYASYLLQASRFEQKHFDFVLVDGVVRAQAAFAVLDLIDERSRVVIHDFWVPEKRNFSYWLPCELLKYYRIEGAYDSALPYMSGGSVVVLQKYPKQMNCAESRTCTSAGGLLNKLLHAASACP